MNAESKLIRLFEDLDFAAEPDMFESNKENEIVQDHYGSPIKRKPLIEKYKTMGDVPKVKKWNLRSLDVEPLSSATTEKKNEEDDKHTDSSVIDHTIRELHEVYQATESATSPIETIAQLEKLRQYCSMTTMAIPSVRLESTDRIEVNYCKLLLAYSKLARVLTNKNHEVILANFKQNLLINTLIGSLQLLIESEAAEANHFEDTTFESESF